ncbi:MAG: TetR/AcrR family transcriptional regulator, partial [Pseudonocardiales bacterium]|nr:TetR/AcrR family transcriptional regulator [Pseudonocardiales bacterium]
LAVHASLGAVQSTLFYRSGVAPDQQTALLDAMAHACLGISPALRVP